MAHDVFICYPSEEKPTADAVVATLEEHRIRCWIAPRDVLPSEDWAAAVVHAIAASKLLVLVFSAETNRSSHVTREVEQAVQRGIPILPFRIEDVTPIPTLEYFIGGTHWLDALTPPLEEHLTRLVGTVEVLVDRMTRATSDGDPASAHAPDRVGLADEVAAALAETSRGSAGAETTVEWEFGGDATPAKVAEPDAALPAGAVPSATAPAQATEPPAVGAGPVRPRRRWLPGAAALAAGVVAVVALVALRDGAPKVEVLGATVTTGVAGGEADAVTPVATTSTTAAVTSTAGPTSSTTAPTTTILASSTTTVQSTTTTTAPPTTTTTPPTTRTTVATTTTAAPALVARNDSYTRTDRRQVCLDVKANDSGRTPLEIVSVRGSQFGSAKPADCGIIYTPPDGIARPDAFLETLVYTLRDAGGATDSATVTISVS